MLNTHLHILRERKETIKFLKEFLWCNLCITLGHTYVAMSEHLAHRFNGHALFKRDERCESVPCGMRGKRKRYTCTKPQGLQADLVVLVLHVWKQRFPFIAVEFFHQPYGFGQQFDTAEYACLLAVELQPHFAIVITDKMRFA